MSAAKQPNAVEVTVIDAVGGVYCHSCGSLETEAAAVKYAHWWMRQRRIIGFNGKPVPVCRPLRLHVERYYDASASDKAPATGQH